MLSTEPLLVTRTKLGQVGTGKSPETKTTDRVRWMCVMDTKKDEMDVCDE